jgi:hypothetical protein
MLFSGLYKIFGVFIALLCFLALPAASPANIMYGGMDSGKSVFVTSTTNSDYGSTEMTIMTRKGTSYALSDLNGTWYGNGIDSQGPWWNRCTFTVTSGSAYVDCTDDDGHGTPGTVAVSIDTNGVMTRTSTNPTWHCHLDSGKTVAVCTETDTEDSGAIMTVLTKKGTYSDADLPGTWYLNVILSPGPYWERGTIEVVNDHTFIYSWINSEGELATRSGTWSLDSSSATVTITPDAGTGIPCKIDSGKTVMACTFTDGGSATNLLVMTKKAASYSLTDMNYTWYTHSLITGPGAPLWSRGIVTPGSEGSFTLSGIDYHNNAISGSGIAELSAEDGLVIDASDCSNKPVKRDTGYYNTVQGAYNSLNGDSQTIKMREDFYYEGLNLAGAYAATLQGGYDCNHASITGYATVIGKVTFSGAAVAVDGLIVK